MERRKGRPIMESTKHYDMPQSLVNMLTQWANDGQKVITVEVKELSTKSSLRATTYVFNNGPQDT